MASNDGGDGLGYLWVLVPMTALLIPITAVAEGAILPVALIGLVMLAVAVGVVGRSVMERRHQQRLELLDAEARIAREDRLSLNEANRIIDRNAAVDELRDAVRAEPPPPQPEQQLTDDA